MTITPTETLAAQIERCFRTVDFEPLRDLYHPDAVLDAAVPQGRFQGQGPERIVAWAFLLGLILILVAISTADAAPL